MNASHSMLNDMINEVKAYIWSHQTDQGGFPPDDSKIEDALTTAEVIFAGISYGSQTCDLSFDLEKAYDFLLHGQDPTGKWVDDKHGWNVATTAWSLYTLLMNHSTARSESVVKATVWLTQQQLASGGFPQNEHVLKANTYATAYALRALSKTPLQDSPVTQRGLNWLLCMQGKAGGWGLEGLDYEPSLTAYVCHGLASLIQKYRRISEAIQRATKWLELAQMNDGSWGVYFARDQPSIEGTAFSLYVLMTVGKNMKHEKIEAGVKYLLSHLTGSNLNRIPVWTCISVLHALESWKQLLDIPQGVTR